MEVVGRAEKVQCLNGVWGFFLLWAFFFPCDGSFAVTQSLCMGHWLLSLQGVLPSWAWMFCLEIRTCSSGVFSEWWMVLLSDYRLTWEFIPCKCWWEVCVKKSLMRLIHISGFPFLHLLIFPIGNVTLYCKVPLFQLCKQTALKLVLLTDGCCISCWI